MYYIRYHFKSRDNYNLHFTIRDEALGGLKNLVRVTQIVKWQKRN